MSAENFDKLVRDRLLKEINRRGMSTEDISQGSGLPIAQVREAIEGKSELSLEDLDLICLALGVNLFWLASEDYVPSKTLFRNLKTKPEAFQIASEMESAFLCIFEFLPTPTRITLSEPSTKDTKCYALLSEVINSAIEFQKEYGNDPSKIIENLNISVLTNKSGGFDAFDAFLLGAGEQFAICLNENHPPSRLKFSFFHELAHYLFHRNEQLDVEISLEPRFYNYDDNVSEGDVIEFIANKFAQYSIVSYESVRSLWAKAAWKRSSLDLEQMQNIINSTGSSIDVLAFSLYEIFCLKRKEGIEFKPLLDDLRKKLKPSHDKLWVSSLISKQRDKLAGILAENEDSFYSEDIEELRDALGIQNCQQVVNG